jgi:hypothetical protein
MAEKEASEFYYYHCAEHIPSSTIHCRKDDKEYLLFPQDKAIEYTKNVYFKKEKDYMDKRIGFFGKTENIFFVGEFKNRQVVLEDNTSITYIGCYKPKEKF